MFDPILKAKAGTGEEITIFTPYGTTTGVVEKVYEDGTFLFKSKATRPFRLYMSDVLFLAE